jgi:hypothetical protein
MKKAIFSFFILIALSGVFVAAQLITRNEFMSAEQAKKKWGATPFDAKKFKSAEKDVRVRASMAADIVERQSLKGVNRSEIRSIVGRPTGYYFSDTIYAYIIEPYSEATKESWQLVLIPDDKLETIKEIKIEKKCCYKEPAWAK